MDPSNRFVHFAILGIRPEWRLLGADEKKVDAEAFDREFSAAKKVSAHCYTLVGTEPDADLMLWLTADSLEDCQEFMARLMNAGLGRYLHVVHSLISVTDSSEYVKSHSPQSQSLGSDVRSKYLIVYPFTKTTDWYLLGQEERGEMMREHARIGGQFKSVRQILGYSFGFDDQEFVVAYETDSIKDYKDLVRSLRGIRVRKYTAKETPVFTGVYRSVSEALGMLV
ncbi:MAG: chlorite dismutase family protein [Candidatus Micrarchaeota archaeon]|nr:chlorite dismutase family protein [Candidatus Micrarchaeota archaeon]